MNIQKVFYGIILLGCVFPLVVPFVDEKAMESNVTRIENETKTTKVVQNETLAPDVQSVKTVNVSAAQGKENSKEPEKKEEVKKEEPKVQTIKQVEALKPEADIVYDGMTLDQLARKLNKSLGSTIANKGSLYASYSLQMGVDPYVAVAITLQETGCKWNCSTLVKKCNNVGGMKGSPGCNGGSYKKFNTIDEGIKAYIDNLSKNYYKKGLNTVEKINTKYASSKTWSSKINRYINEIKSK